MELKLPGTCLCIMVTESTERFALGSMPDGGGVISSSNKSLGFLLLKANASPGQMDLKD